MRATPICLAILALLPTGCGTGPRPNAQVPALVGFVATVDTAVLRSAGVTITSVLAAPPVAQVLGTDMALQALARQPSVAYVTRLDRISDSAGVFVLFRDRPTRADTLSDADRQLISGLGGRFLWVYQMDAWTAVMLPSSTLGALQADSLVAQTIKASGGVLPI
jgi:hypothetical protein